MKQFSIERKKKSPWIKYLEWQPKIKLTKCFLDFNCESIQKRDETFSSNLHKSNCKFEHVPSPGGRFRILVTADLTKILCLSLWKWDRLDAVLNFSKELIVFSRYTGMSVRQSEPPAFCRTKFKGWMTANTSCNIRIVAKSLLDISWKIPSTSGSFLPLTQFKSADNICVYPSQRLSYAQSWAVHLVTLGLTGVMWHSSFASAAFFKKLISRRW